MTLRYAICNETFDGWDIRRVCEFVAATGYAGLEIAPYTLAPLVTDLSAERRSELREVVSDSGLSVVGLHWLLAKTEGFQVTSPDVAVRRRTADYLGELARCCRDLGGTLMVFGSPNQRRVPPGATLADATDYAIDTLEMCLPTLNDTGVTLCLEPLSPTETDFLTTCAETVAVIDRIGHPNVSLHLDVKAMASESEPIEMLIRRYGGRAGHFHANDANRRGPGFGDTDFAPIFAAMRASGYNGWVSVEVFDYTPDPETIARESLQYMKRTAG